MNKNTGNKFSYGFAFAAGLILVLLVTAFTAAPQVEASQAPAEDAPAYCTALPQLYVVNKYGRKTPIANGGSIYRVAGDRVNLYVELIPGET